MNTFNAYFKRHFLSTLVKPIVFAIFGVLVILLQYINANNDYINSYTTVSDTIFDSIIAITCIIAFLTPILEFAQFNNKRNLDTIFSLPISKTKILMAHYINGALQMALSLTAIYFMWVFTWVYAPFTVMNDDYVFIFYPFVVLSAVLVYTIYSFVFLQANTTVDGCVFMFLHTFVLIIILCWISNADIFQYYDSRLLSNMGLNASYFALLIVTMNLFNSVSSPYSYPDISITRYQTALIWLFIILAIIYFVLMLINFNRKTSLNVGNISESWFGYKTLGPIFSIYGVLLFNSFDIEGIRIGIIFSVIVLVIMFLGYILYRRGVKFKIPDIVVMSIATLLTIFGITL